MPLADCQSGGLGSLSELVVPDGPVRTAIYHVNLAFVFDVNKTPARMSQTLQQSDSVICLHHSSAGCLFDILQ